MKRWMKLNFICVAIFCVILGGCYDGSLILAGDRPESEYNTFTIADLGSYDSSDRAILTSIDAGEKTMTFYNRDLDKYYTLNYDGSTDLRNKYGMAISMEQLEIGAIVDVFFLKYGKRMAGLNLTKDGFTETDITGFTINEWAKTLSIGSDSYKVNDNTYVVSDKKKITLAELNPSDILTIRGRGSVIESIVVNNGHGYLSLTGEEYFIGGFLEVGKNVYELEEKMLLLLPEGTYDVRVTHKGSEGTKRAVIKRNLETVVDFSDVEIEEAKEGRVTFKTTPEDVIVKVDGKQIDTKKPVVLTYGLHKMEASREGYQSVSRYFNVAELEASLTVYLFKEESASVSKNDPDVTDNNTVSNNDLITRRSTVSTNDSTVSNNSAVSGNDTKNTTTSVFYVNVPGPSGVEIYWDGNYMGLAPLKIKKTEGTHVITLRKSGYVTRSFTVLLDSGNEDVTYTFDELVLEPESEPESEPQQDAQNQDNTPSQTSADTQGDTSLNDGGDITDISGQTD